MAESSGFFNAELVNGQYDREYLAEAFAKYFSLFIANGVFPNPSDGLQVFENTTADMNVLMHPGYAWIDGYWYKLDGNLTLAIDPADGVLNRIDSIVVRWDLEKRNIYAQVVKGTPASEPTAPEVVRSPDFSDLCVAHIRVDAGTTKIMQSMITDTRMNSSLCGIVTGVVQSIDTTTLFEQYQAALKEFQDTRMVEFDEWQEQEKSDFDNWFETIKGTLDGDTAGNLLNLITQETADRKAADAAIESKIGINGTATYEESTVKITAPEGLVVVTFLAPSDWASGDKYTLNGEALTITDLNGEALDDSWKKNSPVTITVSGGKAFFKAGGSGKNDTLPPLLGNMTVEVVEGDENDTYTIKMDKLILDKTTEMVGGAQLEWGEEMPEKPGKGTGGIKTWTREEIITTDKPYDGLYLGDVTASDAVTEVLLWLPEKISGKTVLSPFIILSADYLGGVYVTRKYLSKLMKATWGGAFYYPGNPVDTFLSSTYLNSVLDKSISNSIMTCSVPVQSKYSSEIENMSRKCWVLSYGELYNTDFGDGTKAPYFEAGASHRIAYVDGGITKGYYWTRSREKGGTPYSVDTSGGMSLGSEWGDTLYIRPAFVLPKDFKIQRRPDGSYTVYNEQGLMTLGDVTPSTESKKVAFNIPETIKMGLATKYAEFVYGMKEYNGYPGGLFTRNDNGFASGKMYGALWTQTDAYNVLTQYATYEPSSLTLADRCLHLSIRKILMSVSVKSTDNGGSIHDNKVKCLLLSTREVNDGTYETGTPIPYYSVQANRIMKDASGVAAEAWLRDTPSSPLYQFRFIGQNGQIGTKAGGSMLEIVPSICIPLDTPIRQLADGSYDLVPDDPALAQSISTMAEAGTPVQLKDVPVSDESISGDEPDNSPQVTHTVEVPHGQKVVFRQFTQNQKKQFQTMLVGGVYPPLGDVEPPFALPEFTGNCAIFGDENAGRIELYESGDLTLYPGTYDLFLVGGGASGSITTDTSGQEHTGGGGGGYTTTISDIVVSERSEFIATVGAGGNRSAGSQTIFENGSATIKYTANGGAMVTGGYTANGGAGGSGGGGFNRDSGNGYAGGSDGSNGLGRTGGMGQGTTTRMFGEAGNTLFSGGGGGAGDGRGYYPGAGGAGGGGAAGNNVNGVAGTANTGGGGGYSTVNTGALLQPGAGGSGIIIVRWDNAAQ